MNKALKDKKKEDKEDILPKKGGNPEKGGTWHPGIVIPNTEHSWLYHPVLPFFAMGYFIFQHKTNLNIDPFSFLM